MGDWPYIPAVSPYINTFSLYTNIWELVSNSSAAITPITTFAWPTANRAIYIPVTIPFPYTIERMFWHNGSAAGGNHYVGIYGYDGAYIWRDTAIGSGNSAPQFVTPSSPIHIGPGRYMLGYSHDSTTSSRCYGFSGTSAYWHRLAGFQEATTNLPTSTPTFATPTMTVLPLIGFTNQAS